MTTESTQTALVSGLALLIEWANKQDNWIRKLVGEVIETRNKLSDERIGELYDLLCREKKIASGDSVVVEMLSAKGFGTPVQAAVQLKSLQHIKNVNAIAENQEIEFHERMTICYGENASGKTGYVRMLKNVTQRTTQASMVEPVLPNIYRDGGEKCPQVNLKFFEDRKDRGIKCTGGKEGDPLIQVDIFDSQALLFHLKRDTSYSYTPAALRLFPLVNNEIERVEQKIRIEKNNTQEALSTHANRFPQGSFISLQFGKIFALTNINKPTELNFLKIKLTNLSQISNEQRADLPRLRENVVALSSGEVQAQIKQAKKEKDIFESTLNIADLINRFEREDYTAALSKLRTARDEREDAIHNDLAGEDIPEVLGGVWKEFIKAAEHYIKEIEIDPYPASKEKCIYCRQPLGEIAVNLLRKYRNYCNDELQKEVDKTREEVRSISEKICELKIEKPASPLEYGSTSIALHEMVIEKTKNDIEELINELENTSSLPPNIVAARDIVKYALEFKKALQLEENCLPLPSNFQESLEITRRTTETIEETIADLSKEGEDRKEALFKLQQKQQDIEARITLAELMPKIDIYFKIVSYLTHFPSIKKNLTITEKQASAALVNKKFTKLFHEECNKFSAPLIKLEFPGRGSETQKRKVLMAGDHALDKILSEGEQKVIALADFLADISLKPNHSPVVFDDPVTSLDYKHLRHVANRLFDLSQERQVIVFTHDIWFARELLERFEVDTTERLLNEIKSEGPCFGIVYHKTKFETDSFSKFENKIKQTLQWAKEEQGERHLDLIKSGYSQLRSACEAIAERDLLKHVTARYRPNIQMTCLNKINAKRLPEAIKIIMEVFDKCSRFTEAHSHPLSISEDHLCLRDLEEDLVKVKKALDEYNNKKSKNV